VSSQRSAYLGLAATVLFWGASFVATKIALRELTPAAVVATRFGIGLLVLMALGGRSWHPPAVKDLPGLAVLGLLGIALHQWLQATGLQTAPANTTAWIVATIPIFVALLGWTVLKERLGWQRSLGIALGAAGVWLVVENGQGAAHSGLFNLTWGEGLILLSSLNWAVFTILSKRLMGRLGREGTGRQPMSPVGMITSVMALGWLLCLPWLAADGGWRGLLALSWAGWAAVGFLGIACSGLAYLFWYRALEVIDATQAGAFLYAEPLVTSLLALPLLGEGMSLAGIAGAAAILVGVGWVNRR
jgi:drug/metabolite transporter (DMT)-like permease